MIPSDCSSADLNTTDNITMDGNVVSFVFGEKVLIPDDNVVIDDEQCFEVGLDLSIRDLITIEDGDEVCFQAFVGTDNRVRSQTRTICMTVSLKAGVILCG